MLLIFQELSLVCPFLHDLPQHNEHLIKCLSDLSHDGPIFFFFNVGLAWIQTNTTFASVVVTLLHFKNVVTLLDIFVSFILELCMVCILLPGLCNSV